MFVTPEADRSGLLIAVVSGGRPGLSQRPTFRLLDAMDPFGADVVWVLSEADAARYETDGREKVTYPADWAFEYASAHWLQPSGPERGGFYGAFVGREWACLEAERRGCWGVLQLDDNIRMLSVIRGSRASMQYSKDHGGLALHADLLSAVTLSTNGRMVGAGLQSTAQERPYIARPGFPYSCFVEQVGPGREHWYGPFEDDITHAFQYGSRADGATAVLVQALRYMKESKTAGGMRANYNHERSVQLQRCFPESAKLIVQKSRSNGRGDPRVFHKMLGGAIRNPLAVTDRELFSAAKTRIEQIFAEWHALDMEMTRAKIAQRVGAG